MDSENRATAIDVRKIEDICRQNDISFLGVFGSYARGDYTADSDIDLLVRFSRRKSLLDLVRIEDQLAARLGKPVDLVVEGGVSPYLRDRILSEVRPIYEAA
jgi:predicted nucleotidyltransferase